MMRKWTFWNWLTYANIGLASFGLAVAALFRVAPELSNSLPETFRKDWWGVVPLALFLISIVILVARSLFWPDEKKFTDAAVLILRTHQRQPPDVIRNENVWRYSQMRFGGIARNEATGQIGPVEIAHALLIVFDLPLAPVGVMTLSSPDIELPQYQVQDLTERYALVYFHNVLPAGTLHVNVGPVSKSVTSPQG